MNKLYKKLLTSGLSLAALGASLSASADQVISDDLIVSGSICVGFDCSNGENFNFDTIRLKENNLRIRFTDTSASGSFPSRDWEITVNDSANGGNNFFAIKNIDLNSTPFKIMDGTNDNALFIDSTGRVGMGTGTPSLNLEIKSGNSPGIRLNQDQTGGFATQSWDVAGNETNFFVRDVTNAGSIPFKIAPGAPKNSLFIANDGDIGFETQTPDGILDIAHPADANNHAVLVSSLGNFGINVDNGFIPRFLFDAQSTGGNSIFSVKSDGKVGIGMGTANVPNGLFDVRLADGTSSLLVDNFGRVGINNNSPSEVLDVKNGRISISGTDSSLKIGTRTGSGDGFYLYNSDGTSLSFWNNTNNHIFNLGNDGSLSLGIDTTAAPSHPIEHANGAYLSSGGTWTNASSRVLKQNIASLSYEQALSALEALTPVTYEYKAEPTETYAGFIAEDVPELVAMNDRKSLSTMDIVAVLTAIIKRQQESIDRLNTLIQK